MLPCSCSIFSPSKPTWGVNQKGRTCSLPTGLGILACWPVFRSKARQYSCSWEFYHAALCFSEPVPQPELRYSSNLAGSPIELVCMVPEGTVASISWKKEGHPLPPEQCHLPSGNINVLQIKKGEKSDCGSYSCNVSNVISWKETDLNLTVTG